MVANYLKGAANQVPSTLTITLLYSKHENSSHKKLVFLNRPIKYQLCLTKKQLSEIGYAQLGSKNQLRIVADQLSELSELCLKKKDCVQTLVIGEIAHF